MSFCPSKDIHSIYLDNEMPSEYVKEYEEHLKNCPDCQREFAKMKAIKEAFKADSETCVLSDDFMDKSFERLQMKLKFSENVKNSSSVFEKFNKTRILYGVSSVAAVALLAVFVPLRLSTMKTKNAVVPVENSVTSVMPYSGISNNIANNVSFNSGKGVVISGNIHESVLSSDQITREISSKKISRNLIRDVDMIKPDIEDGTSSIRITVPGFDSIYITASSAEIELPLNVIIGNFE